DHLIGSLQDRVRYRLPDDHTGGLLNHFSEAFEMLHVESADHIDAGFEQFQYILITLLIAAKRRVGMRQLIDDGHLRMALENRVKIHLLDNHAAIIDPPALYYLESLDQCRGVDSIV